MRNKNLILNYVFLSCLAILFLNDHFFKFEYTSWLTGKLSDIVGIILFPMLLTYLFPKLKQNSVFLAGLLFAFWKSPFSESCIQYYNMISPISIHRVVDYSDIFVVLLLPIPYYLILNAHIINTFSLKKVNFFAVLVPTLFILMSTSPGYRHYDYVPYTGNLIFGNTTFTLPKSKEQVLAELKKRDINIHKDSVSIVGVNKSKYLGLGRIDYKNIDSKKDIFQISNDSLKQEILKSIDESNEYKIDKIKIGDQTIENIQLQVSKSIDGRGTSITLKSMNIERYLREDKVERKLRKIYEKLLEEQFKSY